MKKKISLWQFVGFVTVSLLGVLLHFLYEWTDESVFVAPVSGVNESTWEHTKLLFFPLFAFSLTERRYFNENENFWCVKLCGILTGLLLIPVLYYTYNGAFGKSPDWLNITIFFVSAASVFLTETFIFKKENFKCKIPRLSFAIICVIGALFVLFTFATPTLPIFKDPVTGVYGLNM